MTSNLKKAEFVLGLGQISYTTAPIDKIQKTFKQKNLRFLYGRDLALSKILTGKNSFVSKNGSWIKEGDLYLNSKLAGKPTIILLRNSLALINTKKSVKYHSDGEEIPFDDDKAVEILEKAKKESSAYHILRSKDSIATKDFGKNEDTIWLFKDLAEEYGDFLHSKRIISVPLYFDNSDYINNQKNAYINQLWLGSLSGNSSVFGDNGDLDSYNGAFGVSDKTTEDNTPKRSSHETKIYIPNQKIINRNVKILTDVLGGNRNLKDLEKVIGFFDNYINK